MKVTERTNDSMRAGGRDDIRNVCMALHETMKSGWTVKTTLDPVWVRANDYRLLLGIMLR